MLRIQHLRPALFALSAGLGLVVSAQAEAQVYTYQSTIGASGVPGTDNSHFNDPSVGAVDSAHGHLFVADFGNNRIQVLDTTSLAVVATLGAPGAASSDNSHFNGPGGVAYDPAGNEIFVADSGNNRVQIFNGGTFAYVGTIGVTGVPGTDNSHFNTPVSVAIGAHHQLYVTEYGGDRVQIFDAGTNSYVATLGVAGVTGRDNGHFNSPNGAEYNPLTGQIMVADGGNGRVQLFDATNFSYVASLGGNGTAFNSPTFFSNPYTAKIDPATNLLLVADGGTNDRVQVLDGKTYAYVMTLGTTGSIGISNTQFDGPVGIASDPAHGRIYIGDVQNDRVQVFSTAASPIHASVLPGSRSVQVGTTATIYASMINSGSTALSNCQISLPAAAPDGLTLSYQTTNPSTNALTGTVNTPATVQGNNGLQTFLVSFQGTKPFSIPGMLLNFSCDGATAATSIAGVDTVDLTMSSSPIADVIALAATATGNGIVELPAGGAGAFAVASMNLGASDEITVSIDAGNALLPVTATVCQSNPATGQCLAPPSPSVTLSYPGETTPTFSIFLQASGTIPFDPANSRIFVRFKDSSGELHGSTSVAIETT
jgi:DNA-binding beta-propeller fold protein YncE